LGDNTIFDDIEFMSPERLAYIENIREYKRSIRRSLKKKKNVSINEENTTAQLENTVIVDVPSFEDQNQINIPIDINQIDNSNSIDAIDVIDKVDVNNEIITTNDDIINTDLNIDTAEDANDYNLKDVDNIYDHNTLNNDEELDKFMLSLNETSNKHKAAKTIDFDIYIQKKKKLKSKCLQPN
jgi:hypothetical protein